MHNYNKCKNFRQILLQRARDTDGLLDSFAFQARALQFIFFKWYILFLYYFLSFLQQQNEETL